MHALSRTLAFALLLALLLRPGFALAAATDAQVDTLLRYYADLANEPLTPAETATIRQATIELFDKHAATATDRLARATRALKDPMPAGEIADSLRSMAIGSIGLDGMSEPGGPDARVYAILDAHCEHAKSALPPPPTPTPAPVRAPAAPLPVPPPIVPVAGPPPTPAQLDNVIAVAEWTIGGTMTPEEKEEVRAVVRLGATNPVFRKAIFDVPPADIGTLYRQSPTELANARDKALYGVDGLYAASLQLAANPDVDLSQLAGIILSAHRRIAFASGLPDEHVAQALLGLEALLGGTLSPAEAKAIKAALPTLFADDVSSIVDVVAGARVMTAWIPAHAPDEREGLREFLVDMIRPAADGPGDRSADVATRSVVQAIVAANDRLHPPAPQIPSLLPTPGKR